VLQSSDIATILGENLMATSLGIWFPFIVSMVIKTAQGSSTVAMITAASIVAPLMGSLGFDAELSRAFVVIAIAAGSAVFSHANDSFFWVVTQMSGMNINQGYRTHSLGSAILGVASMIFLYILSLIFI
jgi:GntP family gluconate:H+ symporter